MTEIIVNAATWIVSPTVGKSEPIRRNQLGGHVDVSVDESGCYAVRVELVQHNIVGFDEILARNDDGTHLRCWCFKKEEPRHFKYHGAGEAERSATIAYDEPNRDELDPLHGSWPSYAGAFDNVLTPFIRASVFRCPNACSEDGNCQSSLISSLGSSRKDDETSDHRTTIYNGEGVQHGLNVVSTIGSALGSLLGKVLGG